MSNCFFPTLGVGAVAGAVTAAVLISVCAWPIASAVGLGIGIAFLGLLLGAVLAYCSFAGNLVIDSMW